MHWMRAFLRDVVGGYRALRATPAAALAAALTIALGTGANTAVFAVAYGVLVRPLPFPDPSRIVVVSMHATGGYEIGVPLKQIQEWQQRVRTFETTGAYSVTELTMRGLGEPQIVRTALVTPSFFHVFQIMPVAGRAPADSDSDSWMVLGSKLSASAGRTPHDAASVLGTPISVGDLAVQATAIMPRDFTFPADDVGAWIPAAPLERIALASGKDIPRSFRLMARLKEGVNLQQAADDTERAFQEIDPTWKGRATTKVRQLDDVLFGTVRPALNALLVAGILVLLVACANVAALLVSRAAGRTRDLAVRKSLGASASQLVRAALAESLVIAAAGSILGVGLALLGVRLFVNTATGAIPGLNGVAIDLPVLVVTLLVAAGVTVTCGLAPAVYAVRSDFGPAFRSTRVSASRGVRFTRRALIVAQLAMSIVLLCGAGLLGRTVFTLLSDRAGADPDRALLVRLRLSDSPRFDLASQMPAITEMLRRVRQLPGVEHAAVSTNIPPRLSQIMFSVRVVTNGKEVDNRFSLASITGDFFDALGTRIVEGRALNDADEARDAPVVVLSESAARVLSPDRSLVGTQLSWPLPAGAGRGQRPFVVGIVPDVKYGGLDVPAFGAIYTRWVDLPSSVGYLIVRTSGDPSRLTDAIRRTIRDVNPSLPLTDIRTLRQEFATSIVDRRVRVIPAAGFAVLAVAVALVGLGGLLARAVAERRRELAIRMAVGASPAGAVGIFVREGLLLSGIALILGLGAAMAAARWLESLLYGIRPLDPFTFVGVGLLVSVAALLTSFLAARRAARIQPLELLRSE